MPARSIPAVALALTLTACGADDAVPGAPTGIEVETRHQRGADVAASSGCLGCHRIAGQGNEGPGPDLTTVGARMSRQELARVLVNPPAPMPSYSRLRQQQPADFDALTAFLADLR